MTLLRTLWVARQERMGGMKSFSSKRSNKHKAKIPRAKTSHRWKAKIFQTKCVRTEPRTKLLHTGSYPTRSEQFYEERFKHVRARQLWTDLPPQNTSCKDVYSYAIFNRGKHRARVRVSVGPTLHDFIPDVEEIVLEKRGVVVVPKRFLKFTRISVKSIGTEPTILDIYFQSQSL